MGKLFPIAIDPRPVAYNNIFATIPFFRSRGDSNSQFETWRLLAKMVDEEPLHERDRMVETAGYAKQLRSDRRRT